MIANLNQISVGVRAGANYVSDSLLAAFTVALKPLQHARRIRMNGESAFGQRMLERSVRLGRRLAQRVGHGRLPITLYFLRVAVRTARLCADCRRGKKHRYPECVQCCPL